MLVRYTSWTGTQRVLLTPDRLFEELSRHLAATDDLDEALDRLWRERADESGTEAMGVEELLAAIRDRVRELGSSYNLDHVLDAHRERLDALLERERTALDGMADQDAADRLRKFLARLPSSVRETMDRLAHHRFIDGSSGEDFSEMFGDREAVERVADFAERHGRMFRGSSDLSFEDALEILDEIETLRRMEDALFQREFSSIDVSEAERLLGERASRAIAGLRAMVSMLADAGLAMRKGSRLVLTAKGARRLGELALREIHAQLRFDAAGRHGTERRGDVDGDVSGTRPHRFGDSAQLAPVASVANALRRGGSLPLRLAPQDLAVYETNRSTRSATVLLLDMSWSMSWEGRFAAAKRVALAMQALMRSRFPRDYFAVVGFYTRAVELRLDELSEATWNVGDPFTNLQDGLRLGGDLLERQRARNKNIIVVTDGQPTAYYVGGRLFCEWPMSLGGLSTRATVETLREVERVTQKGVRINTFMLDDSPPLRAFVEKMTAINRGRAFYTTPHDLGRFVLVDYVGRRRKVL